MGEKVELRSAPTAKWEDCEGTCFSVRGKDYMTTKTKVDSDETLYECTKVQFVRGEEVWAFTFDADDFVFRSLKLPETETFDRVGKFQERMVFMETFREAFFYLYSEFAKERNDSKVWKETKEEMRKWVAARPSTA